MNKSAVLSRDGVYRYELRRSWGSGKRECVFIGLNPSTADAEKDDPTIRRCINFAKAWGYDSLCMVNLFAFRATSPKAMLTAADPVGLNNTGAIMDACSTAGLIIVAWGEHGGHRGRDREVLDFITWDVRCLGLTKSGQPRHPLYIRADFYPVKFTPSWRAA